MTMEVPLGDTYYFCFTTRQFSDGVPTTLSGTPVISVKEEANDTVITSGVTLDVDTVTGGVTGLHEVAVVASSGNGYEVGKYYSAYISTGTVGGTSVVGEVVGHFRVMPAEDAAAGVKDVNITHVSDVAEDIATATALATAQTDLDTITGADGATLATAQGLYAPSKAGDAMTLTAAATSAQLVDDVWDEVINGANHNTTDTSGRRLRELRESGFYTDGFIYIDTVNGAADATDYEAGTEVNPTNSIANANTIATSLGLSKFKITPGSTITLAASQTNQEFIGEAWTLALGGQDISGSTFIGASVSGTGTNTAGTQFFKGCIVNSSNITVPTDTDTHFINCGLAGDVTAGEAGEYFFDQCHSAIAGAGSVTFDFGAALNASNLNVRHHSGGWTIANMGAGTGTYNASFEGNGQIVWASATSNASIRGNWKITDNASGAVTETLDDNQTAVDAILVDTGTTLPATLGTPVADIATDIAGVQTDTTAIVADTGTDGVVIAAGQTVATVTDVTNRVTANTDQVAGDATAATTLSLHTAGVITGTAQTGTLNTTTATTDLTGYLDDELIGRVIIFTGGTADGQASDITDYAATNGTVTYTAITTAPVNNDTFVIV
ncbi:MAG: hypothetical protein ACYTFQ_31665 [Planctomycetota bacterium]|jgi:hypothetical protein